MLQPSSARSVPASDPFDVGLSLPVVGIGLALQYAGDQAGPATRASSRTFTERGQRPLSGITDLPIPKSTGESEHVLELIGLCAELLREVGLRLA